MVSYIELKVLAIMFCCKPKRPKRPSARIDHLALMKEYLLCELKEERYKMLMNQENKYSYLFMLCNDMGIIEEQ